MKIIEKSSGLANGDFLYRYTFEDDTDVFYSSEGWECVNFNNINPDSFYIKIAQLEYKKTLLT